MGELQNNGIELDFIQVSQAEKIHKYTSSSWSFNWSIAVAHHQLRSFHSYLPGKTHFHAYKYSSRFICVKQSINDHVLSLVNSGKKWSGLINGSSRAILANNWKSCKEQNMRSGRKVRSSTMIFTQMNISSVKGKSCHGEVETVHVVADKSGESDSSW